MLMTSNGSFTPVIILFYDRHNQNKIIETNSLFSTFFQRSTQDSVIFIDIAEKIQDYSPGRPYAGKQKRKKKNKTLPVGLGPQRGPHWPIGLGYQPGRKNTHNDDRRYKANHISTHQTDLVLALSHLR
jgi:hypothetical protein